jgi:hypothetical protein
MKFHWIIVSVWTQEMMSNSGTLVLEFHFSLSITDKYFIPRNCGLLKKKSKLLDYISESLPLHTFFNPKNQAQLESFQNSRFPQCNQIQVRGYLGAQFAFIYVNMIENGCTMVVIMKFSSKEIHP